MKVLSVNVGLPRDVEWRGAAVRTSIYKEPVTGPVRVNRLNLEGDRQADLSVHGGTDKAVYAYPSEHYSLWRDELPGMDLPWGVFGENLTIEGLLEDAVHIGDRLALPESWRNYFRKRLWTPDG
jgi:MOSC domain-containing protein YiiM